MTARTDHRRSTIILVAALGALAACGGSPPTTGGSSQAGGGSPVASAAAEATPTDVPIANTAPPATSTAPAATATAPPAATPSPTGPGDLFAACTDVASESHYCLTLSFGVSLLGLDSGRVCSLVGSDAPLGSLDASSIAWIDDAVYTCNGESLIRISLRDGSWEAAALPCEAVTAYRGGLLVSTDPFDDELAWYRDFAAVTAGEIGATYAGPTTVSRYTTRGDVLYGAWHSTDTIERVDLASGEALPPIALEEYDDWILGFAVTDDDYLVIGGPGWGAVVVLFDVASGTQLRRLFPLVPINGLACATNVAATPVLPTRAATRTPTPSPTACDGDGCPTPTFSPAPCAPHYFATPRLGRVGDFPPSLPVPSCGNGGTSSNYVNTDLPEADAELHVVAVYEGIPDPAFLNYRRGRVRVTVHPRPHPVVLALSAYEPIEWDIEVEPGAVLRRIVVQGYEAPILEGVPDGVDVQQVPGCDHSYGWEVQHLSSDSDYRDLIADLRNLTGLTETSFQGCYTGDHFDVPHWLDYPPSERPTPIAGDETLAREAIAFPGCAGVTAEATYCLTTTADGLALIGLDSGSVCTVPMPQPLPGAEWVSSLAWRGDIAYVCSQGLIRIHLPDGAWESAQVPCQAVTDSDAGLLLLQPPWSIGVPTLYSYASYDNVTAGSPSRRYDLGRDLWSITASGRYLYGAYFATDHVDVADLESGLALSPIPLDGYNDWVNAMAVVGDRLLVSGWPPAQLLQFDLSSGARLPAPLIEGEFGGLACVTRAAP